jgi:hypothetical protein
MAPQNQRIAVVNDFSGHFGGNLTVVVNHNVGQRNVGRYVIEVGKAYRLLELHLNTLPASNHYATFIQVLGGKGESEVNFDRETISLSVGISLITEPFQ